MIQPLSSVVRQPLQSGDPYARTVRAKAALQVWLQQLDRFFRPENVADGQMGDGFEHSGVESPRSHCPDGALALAQNVPQIDLRIRTLRIHRVISKIENKDPQLLKLPPWKTGSVSHYV
ncbi:gll0526 [Gloeobacter violaceus PCC 7421]|uniref:Gll0526 protein n=1 Tax=Gloeobacter violaceus (strain ATCC 29082 / PCC 7421) TaxID=251221 RepID=Q7NN87_GLOVI|nr:gll0526 [Gloeobacter violaceus PCC 7421]